MTKIEWLLFPGTNEASGWTTCIPSLLSERVSCIAVVCGSIHPSTSRTTSHSPPSAWIPIFLRCKQSFYRWYCCRTPQRAIGETKRLADKTRHNPLSSCYPEWSTEVSECLHHISLSPIHRAQWHSVASLSCAELLISRNCSRGQCCNTHLNPSSVIEVCLSRILVKQIRNLERNQKIAATLQLSKHPVIHWRNITDV